MNEQDSDQLNSNNDFSDDHKQDKAYRKQRLTIEKLMQNPNKIVEIPDFNAQSTKKYKPPDFVRNVMGSSAGAGSGEFHVYRHLRRKEMTRLKELEREDIEEEARIECQKRLEASRKLEEEKTLKRRMKRLKKKKNKHRKNITPLVSSSEVDVEQD